MIKIGLFILFFNVNALFGQQQWHNADSAFGVLPDGFHVYNTNMSIDGEPFNAWYAEADLKSKALEFTCDTTLKRRFTPMEFYLKNKQPLLVVNTTFFSFATNQSLNVVIRNGALVSQNLTSIPMKGKDTLLYKHPFTGAIGISKKRKADVAWVYTDSIMNKVYAAQKAIPAARDSISSLDHKLAKRYYLASSEKRAGNRTSKNRLQKWKMQTAVGGGPVLVQAGKVAISNDEETKFAGKAIYDKHPRTLMGYTGNDKLIIMVIAGRQPCEASGANLEQAAMLMQQLGCVEAINMDGGGSSCMLINGKETIHPSEKGAQRPVPAVFLVYAKSK